MKICVLDMQPISPAVGGGRLRLLGLYHALGAEATYVGTYDWPGMQPADQWLTPTLHEIIVPLTSEHFAAQERLRERVGGKVVIDTTFHQLAALSPDYVAQACAAARAADVVIISHPWVYPLVASVLDPLRQLLVYDAHNIEGVLRMSLLDDNGIGTDVAVEVIRIERELCRAASLILVCSQEDRALFHELYGIPSKRMKLCPNGVFTGAIQPPTGSGREEAKRQLNITHSKAAIFIGSGYRFNEEAACFIIDEIAPCLPSVLFVVGGGVAGSLPEHYQRHSLSNVRITGTLSEEDKLLYLQACDLALNPMFGGSGTNIKMFDYMAAGLPVVTTAVGARGIMDLGSPAFLSVPPEDFVPSINLLLRQRFIWQQMSYAARRLAVELYSWERISTNLGILLRREQQWLARPAPVVSWIVLSRYGKVQPERLSANLAIDPSKDCEIIVVDQATRPSPMNAEIPGIVQLHAGKCAAATAANLGAFLARGEILAFSDDDFVPGSGWIASLRNSLLRWNVAAVAKGSVLPDFVIRDFAIRHETLSRIGGFLPGSSSQTVRLGGHWIQERQEDGRLVLVESPPSRQSSVDLAEWVPYSNGEFIKIAAATFLGERATAEKIDALTASLESGQCDRSAVLEELLAMRRDLGLGGEWVPLMPETFRDEGTFLFRADDFMKLDGAAFVEQVYRELLRRPPEAAALNGMQWRLRNGACTKQEALREVLQSDECARVGARVIGIDLHLPSGMPPGTVICG